MRQTYKQIFKYKNHFRGLQSTFKNIMIDYQIDTKLTNENIFSLIFYVADYV